MERGLRAEAGTFYDDAATMDYKFAWDSLKSIVEMRKNYLEEKVKTEKKRDEDLTKGEIIGMSLVMRFMLDVENGNN